MGFFRAHFAESMEDLPTLDGVLFSSLSEEDAGGLTIPFSDDEVKRVVLESDGNKSPGPDGFNFSFFKRLWE